MQIGLYVKSLLLALCLLFPLSLSAEKIEVKGVVVDKEGEPQPLTRIYIQRTGEQIPIQDMDANFIAKVQKGDKLVFISYGYKTKAVKAKKKFMRVILRDDKEVQRIVMTIGAKR